jgi:hypothetical protein
MRKVFGVGWGVVASAAFVCHCSSSFTTAPDGGSHSDGGSGSGSGDSGKTAHDSGTSHDGGKDSGASVVCTTYATDFCAFLGACEPGTLALDYGTAATCETEVATTCENGLSAKGSGVTTSELTACGSYYSTQTKGCASGPVVQPIPSPSDACAVVGTGAPGAACGVNAQCATDECTRVGTLCGTCTSPGAAGAACGPGTAVTCARGLTCSSKNVCATLEPAGQTCDFGVTKDCQAGVKCVAGDGGATTGTCQTAGLAVGATCNANNVGSPDCAATAGLYCDTSTSKCAAITYGAAGASCGATDGGAGGQDCSDGTCIANKCVAAAASGGSCSVGVTNTCSSGSTCVATDGGTAGVCTPAITTCAASDAGTVEFAFSPSNVSLAQVFEYASQAQVENISSGCQIDTDTASPESGGCLNSPLDVIKQEDGSTVNLLVVQSLTVQSTGSITVTGSVPLIIVSLSDINFMGGNLQANSVTDGTLGAGGGPAGNGTAGGGLGGGHAGSSTALVGAGGGSYCGVGGAGGGGGTTAPPYGRNGIRPLVGGAGGGGGLEDGGNGGGGIQLVAAGSITIGTGSYITVSGGGGNIGGEACTPQNAGGGGSGGSILLEAPAVTVSGTLAANGGGGGGANVGADGWNGANVGSPVSTPAAGGTGGAGGGAGSAGTTLGGAVGGAASGCSAMNYGAGGGGGGAGRIRINSATAAANVAAASISPDPTTNCTTQGDLRSLADGP